jgi:signal transduction histidine kinase
VSYLKGSFNRTLRIKEFHPSVEGESNDFKRVIYFIVAEGVYNAFTHGKRVKAMSVRIAREPGFVTITLDDDGQGFTVSPSDSKKTSKDLSETGIFSMLKDVKVMMGASHSWAGTAQGNGAHLTIKFPVMNGH